MLHNSNNDISLRKDDDGGVCCKVLLVILLFWNELPTQQRSLWQLASPLLAPSRAPSHPCPNLHTETIIWVAWHEVFFNKRPSTQHLYSSKSTARELQSFLVNIFCVFGWTRTYNIMYRYTAAYNNNMFCMLLFTHEHTCTRTTYHVVRVHVYSFPSWSHDQSWCSIVAAYHSTCFNRHLYIHAPAKRRVRVQYTVYLNILHVVSNNMATSTIQCIVHMSLYSQHLTLVPEPSVHTR